MNIELIITIFFPGHHLSQNVYHPSCVSPVEEFALQLGSLGKPGGGLLPLKSTEDDIDEFDFRHAAAGAIKMFSSFSQASRLFCLS